MSSAFDPYYIWLGVPPEDQPPHHYRLLGIELFEANREVIEAAANRQMAYLQEVSSGEEHIDEAQKILGELSRARICLLNREKKKAYDAELRASFDALAAAAEPEPPATTPVADEPLMPPQFGLPDDEAGDDEAGASAAALAGGLPQQPHAATAKKQSSLVPIIGLAVMTLLLIGGGLAFFLSSQAEQTEEEKATNETQEAADQQQRLAREAAGAEAEKKRTAAAARKAAAEGAQRKKERRAIAIEQEKREVARKKQELAAARKQLNTMGIKRINDGSIWQTEQLAAFDKKEKTLTKASSAADLQDVEKLLDDAKKKQAKRGTEAQTLLAQLDKQYTLKPVPKDAAKVLELRRGAKQTLEENGIVQLEGGKNTWAVASDFDLKQLEILASQSKPNWPALEPLLSQYLALKDKSRECHKDDNIQQSLNLLGAKLNEVPSLPTQTADTIKELAKSFLKRNDLIPKDNFYRLSKTEKRIRNLQNKIGRDNKKQSRKKKTSPIPANFNQLVEKKFNEMTDDSTLQKRKAEIETKIKANGYILPPAEKDEYHRVMGMMKGMHSWKFHRPDIPAITAEQVKKEIREELAKKAPELAARQRNTKKSKTRTKKSPQEMLHKFQQELHDNYEKLRKDPQVTLALTIVGSELPPEEGKE